MAEEIVLSVRGKIAWVSLNRPEKRNAITSQMLLVLRQVMQEIGQNDSLRCLVLTGSGNSFSAGADIRELHSLNKESAASFAQLGLGVAALIENLGKPVIAMINGPAYGGGAELAMACHLRVATESAQLGWPEVKLGIMPGWGGTQRLLRLCGRGTSMELCLLGDPISAPKAVSLGLINRLAPIESLEQEVTAIASQIAALPRQSLRHIMASINRGLDLPEDQAYSLETNLFAELCATEDKIIGTTAFLDRAKPKFIGT